MDIDDQAILDFCSVTNASPEVAQQYLQVRYLHWYLTTTTWLHQHFRLTLLWTGCRRQCGNSSDPLPWKWWTNIYATFNNHDRFVIVSISSSRWQCQWQQLVSRCRCLWRRTRSTTRTPRTWTIQRTSSYCSQAWYSDWRWHYVWSWFIMGRSRR